MEREELDKLKEELKAEILKELTAKDYHNPQKDSPFNRVKAQYAKCNGPLHQTFDTYKYARAWDCIRTLATLCVGVTYVREFTPEKAAAAAEIAEYLCKYAIEQRKKGAE